LLRVHFRAGMVNEGAAGNRNALRNVTMARTDGEGGKDCAAVPLTLVSGIGERYAGQHLTGKVCRKDVFLAVQALAQPIIPDLDRGRVIDRVRIPVVIVITDIHVPDQRLCVGRAVTPVEGNVEIGLRTGTPPKIVECGEGGGNAGHAHGNGEADSARSEVSRGGAGSIIVGAGRNRQRDASEILDAGWKGVSVDDAGAARR